jgi:hypothetical protein
VKPTPSDGYDVKRANPADVEAIFQPLRIGRLRIKNRLIRSSISGRIDNYDGSGSRARVNFEERFARGGVGAIISSHAPVASSARVLPNYAMIDCDERIPFWRTVGERVRHHGCAFILQLSHSGRQQDIAGVENWNTLPLGASARMPFGSLILRRLPYGFPLISNSGRLGWLIVLRTNKGGRNCRICGPRPVSFDRSVSFVCRLSSRAEKAFSRYSSMAYCSCIFGRRLRSSCLDATHGFSKSLCFLWRTWPEVPRRKPRFTYWNHSFLLRHS